MVDVESPLALGMKVIKMDPVQEIISLKTMITQEFPQLDCCFHSKEMFLSVTKLSYHGLRYLPSFHLIFTSVSNGSLCSRLITYHGRSIDTFIFKLDTDKKLPSKVCEVLKSIDNEAKLCQGVDENLTHDGLIECLNDIIVARHKKCKFILPSETQSEICEKCQTLLAKNIKKEFQSPSADIKQKFKAMPVFDETWETLDSKQSLGSCLLVEIGEKKDTSEYYEDQSWEMPVSDDSYSIE